MWAVTVIWFQKLCMCFCKKREYKNYLKLQVHVISLYFKVIIHYIFLALRDCWPQRREWCEVKLWASAVFWMLLDQQTTGTTVLFPLCLSLLTNHLSPLRKNDSAGLLFKHTVMFILNAKASHHVGFDLNPGGIFTTSAKRFSWPNQTVWYVHRTNPNNAQWSHYEKFWQVTYFFHVRHVIEPTHKYRKLVSTCMLLECWREGHMLCLRKQLRCVTSRLVSN